MASVHTQETTCNLGGPGAHFSKVPKLYGRNMSDIILFVSSKRRRLKERNFAVILIPIPFTTYEKTNFTEQAGRCFTNDFSGLKTFRYFRQTDPCQDKTNIIATVAKHQYPQRWVKQYYTWRLFLLLQTREIYYSLLLRERVWLGIGESIKSYFQKWKSISSNPLVKVWENSKKLWKHSPAARVPTAFLVLPNFHSCFYISIETRKCFLFLK